MHSEFVYLMGNPVLGFYKIGRSRNPDFRLVQLDKPKLPFPIIPIHVMQAGSLASKIEAELQKIFKDYWVRGEWFQDLPTGMFLEAAAALLSLYSVQKGER